MAWNREKQQEIASIQLCNEQIYQVKLQHEQKKLEEALRCVREDAEGQRKELLLQAEVKQKVRAKRRGGGVEGSASRERAERGGLTCRHPDG